MTGKELWDVFLKTQIPNGALTSLGYDLYFTRARPTGDAVLAVNKISEAINLNPQYTYAAFNLDPGSSVLRGLASDYAAKKKWEHVQNGTNMYVSRVAERIRIIVKSGGGSSTPPKASPSGAKGQSPAPKVNAGTDAALAYKPMPPNPSKPVWPYVLGGGVVVAGLTYLTYKGKRTISRRIEAEHLRLAPGRV